MCFSTAEPAQFAVLQVTNMLTARFQPKLQAATHSRRAAARRPLHVVAFKNGDEEQAVSQDASKAMVTFQLPLHGEQLLIDTGTAAVCTTLQSSGGPASSG